ncbi:MAG: hypothetical protein HWQ41_26950 [Nostoc sp. NOS(2021)]|uniref:hypothetical protein n=1 Tax=Nostoc sp. NOS(2021) TaxID=2815407 RepID=UPI0025D2E844|nr:hypothetical protein [Nostoc sp. NOS(2021)]MBN3898775.1 hypothetical protein [Nostoc sp. NOS(2021)]
MQSTLFTTLTASEEASLSGGNSPWKKSWKPVKTPPKPVTPAKPTIITQVALNVAAGILSGTTVDQTAVNDATGVPSGATVTQTAVNAISGS